MVLLAHSLGANQSREDVVRVNHSRFPTRWRVFWLIILVGLVFAYIYNRTQHRSVLWPLVVGGMALLALLSSVVNRLADTKFMRVTAHVFIGLLAIVSIAEIFVAYSMVKYDRWDKLHLGWTLVATIMWAIVGYFMWLDKYGPQTVTGYTRDGDYRYDE